MQLTLKPLHPLFVAEAGGVSLAQPLALNVAHPLALGVTLTVPDTVEQVEAVAEKVGV